MKQSDETNSEILPNQELSKPDCSTMQCFGANYCRGRANHDGSLVIEFGISGTGPDSQDTKMVCAIVTTTLVGAKLIPMLQQLLAGYMSSARQEITAAHPAPDQIPAQ